MYVHAYYICIYYKIYNSNSLYNALNTSYNHMYNILLLVYPISCLKTIYKNYKL